MRLRFHCRMAVILGLAVTELASAAPPPGWIVAGNAPANYVFAVDAASPVAGSKSASIIAKPAATRSGFGTLMQMIAADDYRGSRLRLSGYLRTANADRSQMWMRVDGPNHEVLAFDNMDSRPVTGTTEWRRYDIVLDVPSNSDAIAFGFFLAGRGKVWGADFRLEPVGAAIPVTAAGPILPRKPMNLNFETAAHGSVEAAPSASFPAVTAGNGRIYIYEAASPDWNPVPEIKLNGKLVGTASPDRFFFGDQPPGDYSVTVEAPRGHSDRGAVSPGTEHTLHFHVNAGQVRYIRLDVRSSPIFVTQVYPELVNETVGRAEIEKINSITKGYRTVSEASPDKN